MRIVRIAYRSETEKQRNLERRKNFFKKAKQSRYTPWRRMGGEEEKLLLILNFGTRWG
jgi:hypothetical protein